MLEVLVAAEGGVVSAEELLEQAWDEHADPLRTPCASRCRGCANGSANPGSSPPSPESATASTRTGRRRPETIVDRAPGLSVRLKLTLSYAGFLIVAGALLLTAVWVFLLRYVPEVISFSAPGGPALAVPNRSDLERAFAPKAAAALAFLLVFGLVGGWLLAGHMLTPLTRITHATRLAADGSLSRRIPLDGRNDEFRELADAFDTMLARLEAHDAEQQRFAATVPMSCARRWRSRRRCSTWPATTRTATPTNSSTACATSTPERSNSPKRCSCSAAPTSGPSPGNTSTCHSSPRRRPRHSSRSQRITA